MVKIPLGSDASPKLSVGAPPVLVTPAAVNNVFSILLMPDDRAIARLAVLAAARLLAGAHHDVLPLLEVAVGRPRLNPGDVAERVGPRRALVAIDRDALIQQRPGRRVVR